MRRAGTRQNRDISGVTPFLVNQCVLYLDSKPGRHKGSTVKEKTLQMQRTVLFYLH